MLTVVQNVECNLGFVMQTEMAVQAIPVLTVIFDRVKQLFAQQSVALENKEGEKKERVLEVLSNLITFSIEGADPTGFSVFESVHPLPAGAYIAKENFRVPRAIGYMIEFDKKMQQINDGNIQIRSSRSDINIHPRDVGNYRNLCLIGSTLSIKFTSNERDQKSFGFRLKVKPIIGKPKLLSKEDSAEIKELE